VLIIIICSDLQFKAHEHFLAVQGAIKIVSSIAVEKLVPIAQEICAVYLTFVEKKFCQQDEFCRQSFIELS